MNNRIHTLPKDIAEKIASGEVVERPLSVVKELVENSLDAGASSVTVEITNGGTDYIRVTDDGSGIPRDDVELAFERFATSKIDRYEDLGSLRTLGFRGVALSSIAAVSKVELLSRTEGQKAGRRIAIEGGTVFELSDAAAEEGTTVVVRELFYNTPERRKFLKSDNSEASLIIDYVSKMALAAPDVRFRMISNGSILFFTQGKGDIKRAIMTVYSPVLAGKLSEVYGVSEKPSMTLKGFAGAPSDSRKSRRYQMFFVNGRWVRSRLLEKAVDEAYSDKLFEGRFPNVFLFLETDPSSLDVNLLPNKTEVRFYDEEAVEDLVIRSIRKALRQPDAAPELKMEAPADIPAISDAAAEFLREQAARRSESAVSKSSASEYREDYFAQLRKERDEGFNVQEEIPVYGKDKDPEGFDFSRLEIVGQVFATYIICRDENCMYIFDQHAAHERVMFERFLKAADEGEVAVQPLIVPVVIQLSAAQKACAEERFDLLESYGFKLEEFGPDSYAVRECPAFLSLEEAESFIAAVLEDDVPGRGSGRLGRDAITMRACKSAVKGNDILSEAEIRQLLADLQQTENPYSCPHGRPTFLTLSLGDIEHMFKRK